MSTTLRRCLNFNPSGNHTPGSDGDYRAWNNEAMTRETGFKWVKFWVFWPLIQPLPPSQLPISALGTSQNPGYPHLQALDAQVARARAGGRKVIILPWQFPRWANGTGHLRANTVEEVEFHPQDRMTSAEYQRWLASGRTDYTVKRKALEYRIPQSLGTTSDYGQWIRFLYDRYSGHGWNLVLELMNEPGLQMWPQMGPSATADRFGNGPVTIGTPVAQMMRSAQAISAGRGHGVPLMAPASDDGPKGNPVPGSTRQRTMYATCVRSTLDALDALSFRAHSKFMWSHHNYTDVEQDQGADTGKRNRAAHVRSLLTGRWSGYPQDGVRTDSPSVFITEGGARVGVVGGLSQQAALIKRNWDRMYRDDGDGAGIAMVAQYLSYTSPYFDSGMREQSALGGAARPCYQTWKSLPSHY